MVAAAIPAAPVAEPLINARRVIALLYSMFFMSSPKY